MHRRLLGPHVKRLLRSFPAVALLGPRQAGKTTLARGLGQAYYDLEDDADRTRLDAEWPALEDSKSLVILDEAQAHPAVFPRLRGAIDRKRKRNGRFLLLGSVSPSLMKNVSESLAGRLGTAELTPFLAAEWPSSRQERLWIRGGYPDGGILGGARFPVCQEEYLNLLVQRDLPEWGLPSKPQTTLRLLRMLAAVHGGVWNGSEVGRSLGLSYHTVNGYLDYLEGAFLIRRLPPFSANLKKRLIKSPKVYWRDSGLLHALRGLRSDKEIWNQPWVGASWEGFVIEQVLAVVKTLRLGWEASYLRTKDGEEVDLVLDRGRERWALEIKLTAKPGPEDFARLNKMAWLIGATRQILVSRLPGVSGRADSVLADLPGLISLLRKA